VIQNDRVGFPMVHLEVDFKSPLAYGDFARVAVRPTRIGRTSVDFVYEVTSRKKGTLCARASATTVTVNLDTFQPIPVPERLRELIGKRIGPA
jgi:acyl-CoA thioesterase FadM